MISGADSGSETGETDGDREAGQEPDGYLEITDPFLPACAGSYQIFTDKAGGARAVKMTEGAAEQSGVTLAISIDGLAQWLFGFRPLQEIAAEEGRDSKIHLPSWTEDIRPIDGVFLDETV